MLVTCKLQTAARCCVTGLMLGVLLPRLLGVPQSFLVKAWTLQE